MAMGRGACFVILNHNPLDNRYRDMGCSTNGLGGLFGQQRRHSPKRCRMYQQFETAARPESRNFVLFFVFSSFFLSHLQYSGNPTLRLQSNKSAIASSAAIPHRSFGCPNSHTSTSLDNGLIFWNSQAFIPFFKLQAHRIRCRSGCEVIT
ncbi:uncharacterized protein F4822DRAFT_105643 [Hypoxylon trugodes]|uniref:uncharacterized protein n=1 Tax=Hypoxylon trugodes TaxID=326681 RepID=UPI00219AEAC6|nr:uncharacterized protein F4822DRAFT_105643 [Hypoxylon trugodes]KAI1391797.1 hypothetical protein F4822DRAFT_105643 [Hypoxylon trugodes]